ncbi:MAG: PAS domain-containing protein, partial [Methylophaga sp.]
QFAKFLSHQEEDNFNRTLSLRMMYVDGTTIPVHMSLSPLNQIDSENIWLLQFSLTSPSRTDINNHAETLQYQLLLDRIEQIVFQINVNHELIFASPAWERLLDYAADETMDRDLFSFIHPEDLLLAEARLNALTHGKRQNTQFELRLIAKNGTSQWFELRAATTSMLKGERSSVIGTLTDISQMKQASAGLRANSSTATEMIMSRIPAMIYRCRNDRNWSLEYVSNGCLEVSEYQPYELVKIPSIPYMSLIHPDDQQTCWEFVQKQIAKQQSFHMIYRLITRSGKTKWVFEHGRGVFSGSDELLSLEGIITDLHCDNYECLQQGLSEMLIASDWPG